MIIYKITNKFNNKSYIGQTIRDINQRFQEHTFPSSGCKAIRDAIKVYGEENFFIEEIAKASSQDELDLLEKMYIETLDTLSPNGYNLKEGGDSNFFAPETLEKMRNAKLGTTVPEETRQKMSESHKERFAQDPSLSEARSVQSKAIWQNEEYRENIMEKRTEYWADPVHRQAASVRAKQFVNDEWKEEISAAVKKAQQKPEIQAKMKKCYQSQQVAVVCSDGREFSSIKEAAKIIGCHGSAIIKNIKGKYKSAGGFTWKHKDIIGGNDSDE